MKSICAKHDEDRDVVPFTYSSSTSITLDIPNPGLSYLLPAIDFTILLNKVRTETVPN